jgi:hypothetical protein
MGRGGSVLGRSGRRLRLGSAGERWFLRGAPSLEPPGFRVVEPLLCSVAVFRRLRPDEIARRQSQAAATARASPTGDRRLVLGRPTAPGVAARARGHAGLDGSDSANGASHRAPARKGFATVPRRSVAPQRSRRRAPPRRTALPEGQPSLQREEATGTGAGQGVKRVERRRTKGTTILRPWQKNHSRDEYFMAIAAEVSTRSTHQHVGAVIVRDR